MFKGPGMERGLLLSLPALFGSVCIPAGAPRTHTANMSEASGLKPSICCKKNEVFKQGPFGVGGCQVGWGLPGRLYHVEMYKQISPGLEHVL